MELLASLEDGPRGVYTGTVGHIPPDGRLASTWRFEPRLSTGVVSR